jgi:addiction module HigA family antidote
MARNEANTRDISPVHPGEHLAEYLDELGVSQYRLSKELHVPQIRISQIVRGKRAITADTALRLGRFFGTSAQYWLNLQSQYELETAAQALGRELEEVSEFRQSNHGKQCSDGDHFSG